MKILSLSIPTLFGLEFVSGFELRIPILFAVVNCCLRTTFARFVTLVSVSGFEIVSLKVNCDSVLILLMSIASRSKGLHVSRVKVHVHVLKPNILVSIGLESTELMRVDRGLLAANFVNFHAHLSATRIHFASQATSIVDLCSSTLSVAYGLTLGRRCLIVSASLTSHCLEYQIFALSFLIAFVSQGGSLGRKFVFKGVIVSLSRSVAFVKSHFRGLFSAH